MPCFRQRDRLRRLLPVGRIELGQIARTRSLPVACAAAPLSPVVKFCPDLTALNLLPSIATLAFASSPISRQSSTKRAHALRSALPLSLRIGDGFVIEHQPPRRPHHLDVAASLTLEPAARLHSVEIAVDVELQVS